MKTKILNTFAIMALMTLWCATGRAQLPPLSDQVIYSNSFNGPFVSVESTAPTYVSADAGNYGGNSAAVWVDTFTNYLNDTVDLQCQTLYQNGTIATNVGSFEDDVVVGRTGFMCRPCDSVDLAGTIERYFESELFKTLDARRQEIREYVTARHSWDVVGEITRNVYAGWLAGEPTSVD